MDIGAKYKYPASSLSNFAGHIFVLDGVEIWSMEGFLQSLKFKDANVQAEVCKFNFAIDCYYMLSLVVACVTFFVLSKIYKTQTKFIHYILSMCVATIINISIALCKTLI
jgi:hypothetical protein